MKKILFTSLFASILLTGGLFHSREADAAELWVANSPEMLNIQNGQTSYTLVLGDTLWAISQRTNLNVQTLADINNINLALGEQYNLPVGRTIYFDGNKVTVKEADGSVVKETIVTDDNKVDTTKEVGEPIVGGNQTPTVPNLPSIPEQPDNDGTNSGTNEGTTGGNDGNGGENVTPTPNPTPTPDPDPEPEPEKVYRGEFIPGVDNGAIGTWTNKQEMMDYIESNWSAKVAAGEWTNDYVASTNGYGWIAMFY